MIRLVVWILGGVLLGGVIHLVLILTLPDAATRDVWQRLAAEDALERVVLLDDIMPGDPNPLGLDPELVYGVCQLGLRDGPGVVNGELPLSFWSVAVFNRDGHVIYSTTNRSGSGRSLDLGVFNPAQTRLLAEQRFEIEEGLLIVEAQDNDVMVVVRLAPPHHAMRERYREALANLRCLNVR